MVRKTTLTTDFDRRIGLAIYQLRISYGLSRSEFAQKIDVTHQQLQKYEAGINRISASRVIQLCHAFKMSPNDLFNFTEFSDLNDESNMLELSRLLRKCTKSQRILIAKLIRNFLSKI